LDPTIHAPPRAKIYSKQRREEKVQMKKTFVFVLHRRPQSDFTQQVEDARREEEQEGEGAERS
jgi:hypothetical protein